MITKIGDQMKEQIYGMTATGAFIGISFQNVLEWLQLVSVILAIIVALLTAYLTHLKIKNEKKK